MPSFSLVFFLLPALLVKAVAFVTWVVFGSESWVGLGGVEVVGVVEMVGGLEDAIALEEEAGLEVATGLDVAMVSGAPLVPEPLAPVGEEELLVATQY